MARRRQPVNKFSSADVRRFLNLDFLKASRKVRLFARIGNYRPCLGLHCLCLGFACLMVAKQLRCFRRPLFLVPFDLS
jgi:hypothetical protein